MDLELTFLKVGMVSNMLAPKLTIHSKPKWTNPSATSNFQATWPRKFASWGSRSTSDSIPRCCQPTAPSCPTGPIRPVRKIMVSCHPRQQLLCLIDLIYADWGWRFASRRQGKGSVAVVGFYKHYSNPKIDKLESWKTMTWKKSSWNWVSWFWELLHFDTLCI